MKQKIVLIVIIVAVAVFGYLYNQKNKEFKLITDESEMTEFVTTHSQKELDEYYRKVDEMKASDIYGGKTPEETLSLYVEALKIGDVELASKYFRLEDQEKELGELVVLTSEDVKKYINMLEKSYLSKYNEVFKSHELRVEMNDTEASIMEIIKIEQSGLWKLKSL